MGRYLVIESRDPIADPGASAAYELAGSLASNTEVTVFLTHNAVFGARASAPSSGELISTLGSATVVADDFALSQRGLAPGDLVPGVQVADIDLVVDLVVDDGRTVIWS